MAIMDDEWGAVRDALGETKDKNKIEPPQIHYIGRIITFDQSLSSTGYAVITADPDGAWIWNTGVLKSTHDLRGHEKTLDRFVELVDDLEKLRGDIGKVTDVIHETPPVGSRMIRAESSLLAAAAIQQVFKDVPIHMVSRQKAAKRWTGNGNIPKKEIRQALMSFGYTPKEWGMTWNEHVADALSIGLLYLENNGK